MSKKIYTKFEYDEEALGKRFYYFDDRRLDIAGLYKTHYEEMLKILIKYIINNKKKLGFNSYVELEDYLRKYSLIMIYYQLNNIPNNNPGFEPYIVEVERLLQNKKLDYFSIMELFKGFNNFSNSSNKKDLFKDLFIKLYLNRDDKFYSNYLKDFIKLLHHINKQALASFEKLLNKAFKYFVKRDNYDYSIFQDEYKTFDMLITDLLDNSKYNYYCIDFTKNGDESDLLDLYANIDDKLESVEYKNFLIPVIGAIISDLNDELVEEDSYLANINIKNLNLAMIRRTKPLDLFDNAISFIKAKKKNDNTVIIINSKDVKNPFDFYFSKEKDKDTRIHYKLTNKGFIRI